MLSVQLTLLSWLWLCLPAVPESPGEAGAPATGITTLAVSDVEQFVRDVFIKGDCANVENIEPIGNQRGIGFFEGGASSIGIQDGIILATGEINNAHGPNLREDRTGQLFDSNEDPDLKGLATNILFDNVGVEFDFTPQKEFVSFNYVFASEEYCEFVGSIFNDVFGFFVSGPGINGPFANGAVNVALVPDTEDFVSINNVNHRFNAEYYIKNELQGDAEQCNIPFAPRHLQEIEYDGFTLRLKAVFKVIPCETYHIRLVVGDVGDDKLDSAVFLESKSFDIGPEIEIDFVTDNFEEALTEGCNEGRIIFRRTDREKIDEDLPVAFNFTSNTVAREGIDFSSIPRDLVIPAFAEQVAVDIAPIVDTEVEDPEPVGMEVDVPCQCRRANNVLFYVEDQRPMLVQPDTFLTCPGETVALSPEILQGAPPYEFRWEDGSFLSALVLSDVQEARDYAVTVTDQCGQVLETSVPLRLTGQGTARVEGTYSFCPGSPVDIPVALTGAPPYQLHYQIGESEFSVEDIMESPFVIRSEQAGTLRLLSFSDSICTGQIEGEAEVLARGPLVEVSVDSLSCPGERNAAIRLRIDSPEPYRVDWNVAAGNTEELRGLGAGQYAYTVTDAQGCSQAGSVWIEEPDFARAFLNGCSSFQELDKDIYVPNAFSPNNDGRNDQLRIFANPDIVATVKAFRVFDRWGNLVYEARNFAPGDRGVGWNGRFKDRILPPGVFVYAIELENIQGGTETISGSVMLMR